MEVDNGRIVFLPSNGNFQATCYVHRNERCVLTRRGAGGSASGSHAMGGRPLGLLASWLVDAGSHPTKASHMSRETLKTLGGQANHLHRSSLRAVCVAEGFGPTLLASERPRADGEAEEPNVVQ